MNNVHIQELGFQTREGFQCRLLFVVAGTIIDDRFLANAHYTPKKMINNFS